MRFGIPIAKSELEKLFFDPIDKDTPQKIKAKKLIDCNNDSSFTFTLTKEQLSAFDPNGEGLGITNWFKNYEKEAMVSTAGIRGLQNPLYPWDTRYPLNFVGITLATMGKILVARDLGIQVSKLAACEVRYNSSEYVELIARLQAGSGIKTLLTKDYKPIPIFLASFLIFMYDLYGGEYVTSSHAISRKIATKDLNGQGSQYIPSESKLFLDKVKAILSEIENKGSYTFNFASRNDKNLDYSYLDSIHNGLDLYTDYLKQGVATPTNLNLIKECQKKIVVECMGGSISQTLRQILNNLNIQDKFDLIHEQEDPFFHQIGKSQDESGNFLDLSCDTTILKANQNTQELSTPVVNTIPYTTILKDYPIGTAVLMADPDADRLVTTYIDSASNADKLKKMGIAYGKLDNDRLLVLFTPNQSFLMTFDFHYKLLKQNGLADKYDWFMLKTSASQHSWDEWCEAHHLPVVNTPVGFKELADSMQQVEKKMQVAKGGVINLRDVFGRSHNLGTKPRLLFAGEESGGMIFGPPQLIKSQGGKLAISMREKSAGEAIIITSALSAWLDQNHINMADYLLSLYEENIIKSRYEFRIDQRFYNESEPDINKLIEAKTRGMEVKTRNNSFFLSLALAYRDHLLDLGQVKEILSYTFSDLDFSDLSEILFCGDGTYFNFSNKTLEVRPSGTDAVNKGYGYGINLWECIKYATALASYDGTRTNLHKKYIPEQFYNYAENYAFKLYSDYKENQ